MIHGRANGLFRAASGAILGILAALAVPADHSATKHFVAAAGFPILADLSTTTTSPAIPQSSPTATSTPSAIPQPTPSTTPPPRPYPPLPRPVFLPALADSSGDGTCEAWIHVQSVGDEPSQAVLLTWDGATDGAACATCPGPVAVSCSGLLGPGATWSFPASGPGAGPTNGVLLSFNVRTLGEIGAVPGDETPVAERMCQAIAAALPLSCDGYRHLRRAYDQGETWAGVPMRLAYGAPLAATVDRGCRSQAEKLLWNAGAYSGLAGTDGPEELLPYQSYRASPVYVGANGLGTVLHIQNRSVDCASVEVLFTPADRCNVVRPCQRPFTVAAGASLELALDTCADAGTTGSVVVNATELLAVTVDLRGDDRLLTYAAVPGEVRASLDGPPLFTPGSPVVFGPLADTGTGGPASVHVQNLDSSAVARVRLTLLDPWGSPDGLPLETDVCPGGGTTFDLPPAPTGNRLGSARVESLGSGSSEDPPPNVSAVVTLSDAARDGRLGQPAATYRLQPESQAFRWPDGEGRCGAASGAALLALPAIDASTDRLVVANAVPYAGVTQVAVLLFDQNGLVGGLCPALAAQQAREIVLDAHGPAGDVWRGGALVSAAWWSHAVIDARRVRNVVGLTAVVLQRATGSEMADDLAATVGLPLRPNRDLHAGRIPGAAPPDLGCPPAPPGRSLSDDCGRPPTRTYLPLAGTGR